MQIFYCFFCEAKSKGLEQTNLFDTSKLIEMQAYKWTTYENIYKNTQLKCHWISATIFEYRIELKMHPVLNLVYSFYTKSKTITNRSYARSKWNEWAQFESFYVFTDNKLEGRNWGNKKSQRIKQK